MKPPLLNLYCNPARYSFNTDFEVTGGTPSIDLASGLAAIEYDDGPACGMHQFHQSFYPLSYYYYYAFRPEVLLSWSQGPLLVVSFRQGQQPGRWGGWLGAGAGKLGFVS